MIENLLIAWGEGPVLALAGVAVAAMWAGAMATVWIMKAGQSRSAVT